MASPTTLTPHVRAVVLLSVPVLVLAAALTGCSGQTPTGPTPGLSADQVATIVDARNEIMWERLGLAGSPPAGSSIRELRPLDAWGSAMADCMRAAGYPSYVGLASTYDRRSSKPATKAELIAFYECGAANPTDPVEQNYLSREQLDYIYSYYQRSLIPCLRAHGVTSSPAPQRAEFLRTIFVADEFGYASWSPYEGLTGISHRLFTDCPPSPPGFAYALEDWRK